MNSDKLLHPYVDSCIRCNLLSGYRKSDHNQAAKFDGNSATYLNTGVTSDFNYATNDFTVGFDTYKSGNQSEARILSSMANNPRPKMFV